jgi:hypothetical protein
MPVNTTVKQRRRFSTGIGVATVALFVLGTVPAGATVVDRGQYQDTFSDSYSDCGFLVNVEGEFSGMYRMREGKHKNETAFFLLDNFSYREVHTNPETGEFFVIHGDGVFNETRAVRLSGNQFEFTSVEAGQPFVVEDSAGNVVVRDRGVIRRTIVFDTEGDDVPGGIFIEDVSVEVSGPHPGFSDDFDFCAMVQELIG